MKLFATVALVILSTLSALADEMKQQPAPTPSVDPNQTVTLTISELHALLQAERIQAQAAAIVSKINAQIKLNAGQKK